MQYSSHIGAVVVENVRIYHDLGYILVICEYLQHKILECLLRRAKLIDASTAAYYCLQVSSTFSSIIPQLKIKKNELES